jgi:hypothetical protein
MMEDGGFFLFYRRAFRRFNCEYCELAAWLWLIGAAGYDKENTGELITTLSDLAGSWGWFYGPKHRKNTNKVKKFLDKLVSEKRLIYFDFNDSNPIAIPYPNDSNPRSIPYVVKIVNYEAYQKRQKIINSTTHSNPIAIPYPNDSTTPLFVESSQIDTSPKQEKQEKQKKEEEKKTARKPRKLPLSLEKQIEKRREDIQKRLDTHYKVKYPLIKDFYAEIELSLLWAEDTGREIKSFSTFLANWLRIANEKASNSLSYNNNTESDSFLDQVKKEAAKLKQINERFTK